MTFTRLPIIIASNSMQSFIHIVVCTKTFYLSHANRKPIQFEALSPPCIWMSQAGDDVSTLCSVISMSLNKMVNQSRRNSFHQRSSISFTICVRSDDFFSCSLAQNAERTYRLITLECVCVCITSRTRGKKTSKQTLKNISYVYFARPFYSFIFQLHTFTQKLLRNL